MLLISVYGISIYLGGTFFLIVLLITLLLIFIELTRLIKFQHSPALFLAVLFGICFSVFHLSNIGINNVKILMFIVAVVVITDIFGYLFGRLVGGIKVLPFISPGKTWSGVISGWFGAMLVGFFAQMIFVDFKFGVLASLGLSISAQLGDFFESFLKRRAGIKDSSQFLPGHGGFLDRFDGMLGASFFYGLVLIWHM
jgi:phosphatidate cytidylyltransferase